MRYRAIILASVMALAFENASAQTLDQRAAATAAAMTPAERDNLAHGIMAIPFGGFTAVPPEATLGAGYIAGVPRLGVPALRESDASLGVAWIGGLRHDGATALPSGMALGSSWDPDLERAGGLVIGAEAKAKGFNVLLAGGGNLVRDPRGGRTFEYLSEDPLLSGTLAGAAVAGVQANHIISTLKHFALNDQETARHSVDVHISDAAARESDLLAFEIEIERSHPGSVMCGYNLVNGAHDCDSDYLLNQVLKRDWGYKGFVMSDWGAVPGLQAAQHGLDQQSGSQLDAQVFFAQPLLDAAGKDQTMNARLTDIATRVMHSVYYAQLDPNQHTSNYDEKSHLALAQQAEASGVVLLRNQNDLLPLAKPKKIVVIGGYAAYGVISGGGSSQVQGKTGPAFTVPVYGPSILGGINGPEYLPSVPLDAIKARAKSTDVTYRGGDYIAEAVTAAKSADVAIVFATQWSSEGYDEPDISLPNGQDALIAAVAAANPHTIVVLETSGPVLMPWLDKTAAVMEAWFPGARGAEAITSVLFGDVNPAGHLPVTFPASLAQLPRPKLDGLDTIEPDFTGTGSKTNVPVNYDIEGSDVGYRWFVRTHAKPLFPFGFGLSYTSFTTDGLRLEQQNGKLVALAMLHNTGKRTGSGLVQLYVTDRAGKKGERLAGFEKLTLQPGDGTEVTIPVDARLLADWAGKNWHVAAGSYSFALGSDASTLSAPISIKLDDQTLAP